MPTVFSAFPGRGVMKLKEIKKITEVKKGNITENSSEEQERLRRIVEDGENNEIRNSVADYLVGVYTRREICYSPRNHNRG